MKKNDEILYDIYEKYKEVDYGINKDEFEEITNITDEQMKKHPDRSEQILMEYCNMMLRNKLMKRSDVLMLFLKKFDMYNREVFDKYNLKEDSMCLRKQEDRFMRIIKAMG